jgi:biopolymer transport protein ExbB
LAAWLIKYDYALVTRDIIGKDRDRVFELVRQGGWVMLPIILCSIVATAIIGERLWALRRERICPRKLVDQIWQWAKSERLDAAHISVVRASSPLGRVLAAGLSNRRHTREIMKASIEDTGRHVVHELERYLNTLGTIAAVSPLLGLLGTVIGTIQVFHAISAAGAGNPQVLSSGISTALLTTAGGLIVAIPTLMFYRYFRGRIDAIVVEMEQEALRMVEILHGERDAGEGQ